jgi:antitoxin CptB
MTEPRDERIKRLRYRAWRRGFKEADLIMGRFADSELAALDADGLEMFERLLGESDQDLYAWVTGRDAPPAEHDHAVLARLKAFTAETAAAIGGGAPE